jgi:hypothetical protein
VDQTASLCYADDCPQHSQLSPTADVLQRASCHQGWPEPKVEVLQKLAAAGSATAGVAAVAVEPGQAVRSWALGSRLGHSSSSRALGAALSGRCGAWRSDDAARQLVAF